MAKGEIARNEQFLLFLQCFLKTSFQGASKGVIVWEWVKAGGADTIKLLLAQLQYMTKVCSNFQNKSSKTV